MYVMTLSSIFLFSIFTILFIGFCIAIFVFTKFILSLKVGSAQFVSILFTVKGIFEFSD